MRSMPEHTIRCRKMVQEFFRLVGAGDVAPDDEPGPEDTLTDNQKKAAYLIGGMAECDQKKILRMLAEVYAELPLAGESNQPPSRRLLAPTKLGVLGEGLFRLRGFEHDAS